MNGWFALQGGSFFQLSFLSYVVPESTLTGSKTYISHNTIISINIFSGRALFNSHHPHT